MLLVVALTIMIHKSYECCKWFFGKPVDCSFAPRPKYELASIKWLIINSYIRHRKVIWRVASNIYYENLIGILI